MRQFKKRLHFLIFIPFPFVSVLLVSTFGDFVSNYAKAHPLYCLCGGVFLLYVWVWRKNRLQLYTYAPDQSLIFLGWVPIVQIGKRVVFISERRLRKSATGKYMLFDVKEKGKKELYVLLPEKIFHFYGQETMHFYSMNID